MPDTAIRTLIVDDEPDILEFVKYNLTKEGHEVYTAANGREGIKQAKNIKPDLILLDLMMPVMDGMEACYHLRSLPEFEHTRIAFLTARHEEYSEIAGLEAGADDYIQKPIRPRLLITRIKTLLRRGEQNKANNNQIKTGDLRMDREKHEVFYGDRQIELVKKEFDILWEMALRPGKVFSRDELFRKVWGSDIIVGHRTIDVHISKIRDKVGEEVIKTVKGMGYKVMS